MVKKNFIFFILLIWGLLLRVGYSQQGEFDNQLGELITIYQSANQDKPNKDTKMLYDLLISTREAINNYQQDSTYLNYKELQNRNNNLLKYAKRFDSDNARKVIFWSESLRDYLLKNPKSPEDLPQPNTEQPKEKDYTVNTANQPNQSEEQGSIIVQSSPISRIPEMTIIYFLFGIIILLFCITWLNAFGRRKKILQAVEKRLTEQSKLIESLEKRPQVSPTEIMTTQSKVVAIETSITTFFQEVEAKINVLNSKITEVNTKQLDFGKTVITEINQMNTWIQEIRTSTDLKIQQLTDKIHAIESLKADLDAAPILKGKVLLPLNSSLRETILKIGSESNIHSLTHLSQTLGLNNPTQQGDLYAIARFAQLSYVAAINDGQAAYKQLITQIRQLEVDVDDQTIGRSPHAEHYADNVTIENYRESARLKSSEFPNQQHVISEIQQRISQGNIAKGAVVYILIPSVFYLKDGLKLMVARGIYILNA